MIGVGAGMAIAAGASALGSTISGILNYRNQQNTNTVNKKILREQWAREDNAVQRRKADLIAAGMNPALAADGSGAGAGGTVQMTAPQHPDYGAAVSNALNIMTQKEQLDGIKKDNQLKQEQSALNNQQMLAIAEDIKQKRLDLAEKQYNLDKYKQMGVPTNTGFIGKNVASLRGFFDSPEFEQIKNTPVGKKLLDLYYSISDGAGMSDVAKQAYLREQFELQEKKGALQAREEAYKNRKELEKYKAQKPVDKKFRSWLSKPPVEPKTYY